MQKMFDAEDIVSKESQQQKHVYNLLVALKHLSVSKQRLNRQDTNSSNHLALQTVRNKGG